MLIAYIILGLIFGCSIIMFIVFMFKLKMKEGAAGELNNNKIRNDEAASYNRF